ncbi:MAG: HAD-IB family phosphatase [Candidatus Faecivicinus sp.]
MTLDALKKFGPQFVFDLDSTITRCELLPEIAREVGLEAEIAGLTEQTMRGEIRFPESFLRRTELLQGVPLRRAREIAAQVPVNRAIAGFLAEYPHRCLIMTGNLDVWIESLIERLGMRGRCMCSRAIADGDRLLGVQEILDKETAARSLQHPFVAIGDGSNDAGMLREADFGIGFGGVRTISEDVRRAADIVVDSEEELCHILRSLI